MNESILGLLLIKDKWTKQVRSAPGQSIEVSSPVSLCTLDIILRCAFSYSSDVQNEGSGLSLDN